MRQAPFRSCTLALASAAYASALLTPPAAKAQIPDAVITDEDVDAVSLDREAGADRTSSSERLFARLRAGEAGKAVDDLVEVVMTELEGNCPAIESYQVFNRSASFISMKVKCVDRATHMLTVGPVGIGVLSGGDGSIDRIRPGEGEIQIVNGEMPTAPAESGPSIRPGGLKSFAVAVGLLLLLIAAGIGIIYLWLRRQRRTLRWRGLRSEDKDALIEASERVSKDLYRHPDGIWIVKGKRGKRRLFEHEPLARLYRDRGVKILQVR